MIYHAFAPQTFICAQIIPIMFFDIVMSSGFHPKITLPTRITDTSNTLIDNILTNVYDDKHVSGILINKKSDHQPIFTCNNKATPLCKESKYIQIETKDERSLSRFLDDLQECRYYQQIRPKYSLRSK